jgi:DNA primase
VKDLPVKKLWEDISLSQWKDILTQIGAGNSWKIKGRSLQGNCPFPGHRDARPSCWIVPDKGFVKCFGCQKYQSNALLFISQVGKLSWSGAARLLRSKGVKTFPKTVEKKLAEEEIRHATKEELFYACNKVLVEASLNRNDQKYLFAQSCVKYLESRGISADTFKNLPIGVLPPGVLLNQHVRRTDEVYNYAKPVLTPSYIGALVFCYHKAPSEISRFKIRADFMRQNKSMKDEQFIPDSEEDGIGFLGLKNFMGSMGNPSAGGLPAVLVEGEFDALAHLTNYLKGITYDIVLGVGGAGSSSPDLLRKACGITKLLIVADHPDHGGDGIAKSLIKSTSLSCKVFDWPEEVKAKDPHEAIATHGWDTWVAALNKLLPTQTTVTERANFISAHKWLIAQTKVDMEKIDKDDVAEVKRIVAANGSCLRDPDSQRLYCIESSKFVPLSLGTLLELVVGQDDSEEGFVSRITQALADEIVFIGIEGVNSTESIVRGWSRKTKTPLAWRVSRVNELLGKLESELGPAADWVKGNVGIPRRLASRKVGKSTVALNLIELNAKMEKYLRFAVGRIIRGLPSITGLDEMKAGAHYVKLSFTEDGSGEEEDCWAIVNGYDVYIGRFTEGGITWFMLDGPKVGNFTFDVVKKPWSKIIDGCDTLQSGSQIDLEETYDFLVCAIHNSWTLKGGLEDAEYIAAAIMLTPVTGCLPHPLYTMLNGQRGSGKSKLLGLVGGKDPKFRLLESTIDIPASYTAAGTRKDVNRCGLGLVLDEFEDTGDNRQSRMVREILIDIRELTSSPSAKITRGNAESKEVTEYIIKSMIWCCGIQYLRDEADISRFMQFESIRKEDHPEPHLNLMQLFGAETLAHFKRNITLGMFSRTQELCKNISELQTYYHKQEVRDTISAYAGISTVPTRLLDSIVITSALIKLVGRDPHSYIKRVVSKKIGLIDRITSSTHAKDLLDQILSARAELKRPGSDSRTTTIRTILADKTDRHRLRDLDCGLAYTQYTKTNSDKTLRVVKVLVVMWPDVLQNILSKVPRFAKEKTGRLKRMGDSSDNSLSYHTVRKKIGDIRGVMRPGITSSDVTFYDISEILDEWDNL